MHERGHSTLGGLRERRPIVPAYLFDLYEGFYEADRDGMTGSITFRGMNDVLNEYGITDKVERRAIRQIWKQMESARLEIKREGAEVDSGKVGSGNRRQGR